VRQRVRIWFLLALIIFSRLPVSAAPAAETEEPTVDVPVPVSPGVPLSLSEAERLAIAASPALRAAGARIRREEGHLRQAGLLPNPDLALDANWFTHDLSERETILSLRQPIMAHGKRGLEKQEAAERIEMERADADRVRLDLLLQVRESFYRIGFLERILEVLRQNLEAARAVDKAVESRVSEGDAPPFDGLRASVEVTRAESRLRQADGELEAETSVFSLLLGRTPGAPMTVAVPDRFDEPDTDLPALVARALENQPEIAARHHAARAAAIACDRARIDHRPDVAVGPTLGVDQGDGLVGFGLSLRIPAWDRGQGRIQSAEAARDEATADLDAARLAVSGLLVEAYGRFRSATDRRRLYEEGLMKQADELVELTRKSYEGGASGILDLLDARRTALAVKEEYYRACLDSALAATRLRRAIGETAGGAP
jgi:cobalt-zinc-cadmium efflux system outer membrane protein